MKIHKKEVKQERMEMKQRDREREEQEKQGQRQRRRKEGTKEMTGMRFQDSFSEIISHFQAAFSLTLGFARL